MVHVPLGAPPAGEPHLLHARPSQEAVRLPPGVEELAGVVAEVDLGRVEGREGVVQGRPRRHPGPPVLLLGIGVGIAHQPLGRAAVPVPVEHEDALDGPSRRLAAPAQLPAMGPEGSSPPGRRPSPRSPLQEGGRSLHVE